MHYNRTMKHSYDTKCIPIQLHTPLLCITIWISSVKGSKKLLTKVLLTPSTSTFIKKYVQSYNNYMYIDRQKNLITSQERHSVKSKESKLIMFGHQISCITPWNIHLKNKGFLSLKGEKCVIAKGHFQKLQKLLASRTRRTPWAKATATVT